jgi:beta-lactamase superfamily II metal-dependent hydrolase
MCYKTDHHGELRILAFLVCLGFATGSAHAQTLRVYHIDVEQASSTLLIAPGGKTLLVDSGKNTMGGRIKTVMDQAGVTKVDHFVCTHYHEDHYGGIDDLVKLGAPVLESYDRGDKECCLSSQKKGESTYVHYQREVGEDAIPLRRGMTIPLDPGMTVTCISSGGTVIGEANPATGVDENDMSVSLLITYGAFRYFIGGDIEEPTEAKIAARDLVTGVSVYVADHHGSHSSSSADFMRDLALRSSSSRMETERTTRIPASPRSTSMQASPRLQQSFRPTSTSPAGHWVEAMWPTSSLGIRRRSIRTGQS